MKKVLFIISFYLLVSCSKKHKEYDVFGIIQKINSDQKTIIVDHDSIPGFMMPMVMPFNFQDKKDIIGINVGDSVKFRLVLTKKNSYATNFIKLGSVFLGNSEDDFWEDEEFSQKNIGDFISDVNLVDINDGDIYLSSLNKKFKFISFIFTRCPIPNMCPAVVIKNGVLANNFRRNKDIELIMVSFDYIYDSPEILKEFYGESINKYENWRVWSSQNKISDLYTLSSEIGCQFWGIEENNIGHNLRSALIGPNMELLKVWEGDEWLAKNVTRDIKDYMKIMK
tara:strand:+ start:1024 stop:1869 length:846 start_codon:yes stop_codon:yes gene_type:complete